MITIIIFALTAGIVGLYYEFPIIEIIRHRPFDLLALIFYVFPFGAAFIGGVIGYCVARLMGWGCLKTMEEINTATLEPFTMGNRPYYLLKSQGPNGVMVVFFSKDQSAKTIKNIMNSLPVAKWVKIKEEDRRNAVLKVFKPIFVQPKLKFWARLSSQEIYIISVPKNAIFDGMTQ